MTDPILWSRLEDDEASGPRRLLWLPWLLWAAIVGVTIGLVLYASHAAAQENEVPIYVAEHDGLKLRLLSAPCTDAASLLMIVQRTSPKYRQGWRASSSDWRMRDGSWQTYEGCWLELKKKDTGLPDDIFILVFSDGQTVEVFKRALLPPKGPGA